MINDIHIHTSTGMKWYSKVWLVCQQARLGDRKNYVKIENRLTH